MSWEASAHVLKLADSTAGAASSVRLSPVQLLVLYVLAARHHRDARCAYGQYRRMAADTHLAVSTLVQAINEIEDLGIIRVYFGPIPRFKDAPRNADGTPDKRAQRGNLYCFVDLDPDDGPNVEDAEPRRRAGGRPKVSSASANSLFDDSGQVSSAKRAGELAETAKVSSAKSAGQLADLSSNLHNRTPVNRTSKPEELTGDLDVVFSNANVRDDAADGLWQTALGRLKVIVEPANFDRYLAATTAVSFDDKRDVLVVAVASPFHVPWLEGKLGSAVYALVGEQLGRAVRVDWRTA